MVADQPACKYFTGIEEVSQVRPREVTAGIAGACFIKGCLISGIHARFDNNLPLGRECHPGSSVPGREHAVEQVNAETYRL